jgi:hypothetical protein
MNRQHAVPFMMFISAHRQIKYNSFLYNGPVWYIYTQRTNRFITVSTASLQAMYDSGYNGNVTVMGAGSAFKMKGRRDYMEDNFAMYLPYR